MKVKTEGLIGVALDWAVAVADGWEEWDATGEPWEAAGFFAKDGDFSYALFLHNYKPSSDWAQGGPLVEWENIDLISPTPSDPLWQAMQWRFAHGAKGPTPLVAAMRCFVESKLGKIVDIPEKLLK